MEKESGAGSIGSDARERERAGEIISEELKNGEGGRWKSNKIPSARYRFRNYRKSEYSVIRRIDGVRFEST